MPIVHSWIKETNLSVFLKELSLMAGEELDTGIQRFLIDEIMETNSDGYPPSFAEHIFKKDNTVKSKIGKEQGTSVLMISIEVPVELFNEAETLAYLLQKYELHA